MVVGVREIPGSRQEGVPIRWDWRVFGGNTEYLRQCPRTVFFLSWEWRDSSRGVQNRSGSIFAPIWGLYVAFVGPFCEVFARYWVILGVGTVFLLSFGVALDVQWGG